MSKPVAVIRTLEDSPEWLDQRLVEAYLRTTYCTLSPFFPIKIGHKNEALEKWLEKRRLKTYVFITAWNPRSKLASDKENSLKNRKLKIELEKVSFGVLPGLGEAEDGDWPAEESFWALDISPNDAIYLGKKYEQNAIVWWEKGGLPELWWLSLS
ncbi:MAG: hypothetical protein OHK0019_30340 [Saprospiraceae bacterium]